MRHLIIALWAGLAVFANPALSITEGDVVRFESCEPSGGIAVPYTKNRCQVYLLPIGLHKGVVTYTKEGKYKILYPLFLEGETHDCLDFSGQCGLLDLPESSRQRMAEIRRVVGKSNLPMIPRIKFKTPVEGDTLAVYGDIIKSGGQSIRLSGINIRPAKGGFVFSPEEGRIIIMETVNGLGGVIAIAHGYGTVTTLMGLSINEDLELGDIHEKGHLLGVASRSYVHWGVSFRGMYVNPLFSIR